MKTSKTMKHSRTTKQALFLSIMAMFVCVAMLIGTTLAWFTDTASTAVNKIQAGNLDVAIEMQDATGNWVTAEGKTLNWVKAAGGAGEAVLWEPGCTYKLESFKIKNNGNLALKYKIIINGITGSAKLLEAINFTVSGVTGAATATALNNFESSLAPNTETGAITISGHMKEEAGNEYQGLSIDGIGITVVATQLGGTLSGVDGEYDSNGNEYDKNAVYPPLATYIDNTTKQSVTLDESGKTSAAANTVISDSTAISTIPAGTTVYSDNGTTPVATDDSGSLNRSIKTTAATADSVTYDISYQYAKADGTTADVAKFSNVVENIIPVSTGLKNVKVTHTHGTTTTLMNMLTAMPTAPADNDAYYDSTTGKIYIWSSLYSTFEIAYENDFAAAVGGQGYATLAEAITAAKSGEIVTLMKDVTLDEAVTINEAANITLDLNGKVIIENGTGARKFVNKGILTIKDGATGGGIKNTAVGEPGQDGAYGLVDNFGTLTIENGNFTDVAHGNGSSFRNRSNATLIIKGGTFVNTADDSDKQPNGFTGAANAFIYSDGLALNITGGTFTMQKAKYTPAIKIANGTTATIDGATISTYQSGGIEVAGGNLTLSNTNISVSDKNSYFANAIALSNDGVANVLSGTFTGYSYGTYIYTSGGTINISGGTFEAGTAVLKADNDSYGPVLKSEINVSGGTFTGAYSIASDAKLNITGGTFASDPSAFVAAGYHSTLENGVYHIAEGTLVSDQEGFANAVAASENSKIFLSEGTYKIPVSVNKTVSITGTQDTVIDISAGTGIGTTNGANLTGTSKNSLIREPKWSKVRKRTKMQAICSSLSDFSAQQTHLSGSFSRSAKKRIPAKVVYQIC